MVNMSRDQTADDILELRAEAASARKLAATFDDGPTVTDLLNYAAALDREAAQLESAYRRFESCCSYNKIKHLAKTS